MGPDALWQDARFALRLLRRNPGFAAVAVLTLGLGIGANTLVFTLLDAVVLRPLAYAHPERLYMLFTVESETQRTMVATSYPSFAAWREQTRTFESLAAFHFGSYNLTGGGEPEEVDALMVSANLFDLLGIRPILGRTFAENERERVAVLSGRIWKRRYSSDPTIIGRTIPLDGKAYTVLGILPEGFHFPPQRFAGDPEVFLPMIPREGLTSWYLRVIGRIRPGVTEQQARAEMNAIAARLAETYPAGVRRQGIKLDSMQRSVTAGARQTGTVLMGAVAFVLLIACSNLANLLLSQGAARQRELAIRAAVGASRGRLVCQLLMESLVLAAAGGIAGLLLARWGLPLLDAAAPERTIFFTRLRESGIHLNPRVFAFTAVTSLLAAILFGLAPAWKTAAPARHYRQGRLRGALIALEVSVAFVLLAGAGLMVNSMVRLLGQDLGFRTDHRLTLEVNTSNADAGPFFRQAQARLATLPGVVATGAIGDLPLTRDVSLNTVRIQGEAQLTGHAYYHFVSADYFQVIGIPVLAGRAFTAVESTPVALVNRTMAEKYWPHGNPVGQRVVMYRRSGERPVDVIGIVGDTRMIGRDIEPTPEMFFPYWQYPRNGMAFVLHTSGPPESLLTAVKREVWRIDADQPVTNVRTMDSLVATDLAWRRFVLVLIGIFALTAMGLAGVGIYGVVAYSVRQRTQEIGVRMALGARRGSVVWLVFRQTTPWIATGLAAGGAGAAALTRLLAAHLYEVQPRDPLTFALAAAMLLLVAAAANAVPARQATRVDPIAALRYE